MSDGGYVVLDIWIAIEKLVASAPDEDSANRKMNTAIVNATRSAGTPACSIAAIQRMLLMFISKNYGHVQSASTTRL
jgi:hypothetical protein